MNRFLQSHANSTVWSAILFTAILLALCPYPVCGQAAADKANRENVAKSPPTEPVPEDTCILELTLPEGATINVDGNDYGAKRRVTWPELKPGTVYQSRLTVTFPGKGRDDRTIIVEGGRRIRLALSAPNPNMPKIVPQMGHTNVLTARMSSDGRWLLTGGADGLAILWDVKTGRSVHVFRGLGGNIDHVAMSRDGMRVLAASSQAVGVWDLTSSDQPKLFQRGSPIRCAEISPDGHSIATTLTDPDEGYSNVIAIWDIDSGRRIHTLRGHDNGVEAVAFSLNGRRLLSGTSRQVEQTADLKREMLELSEKLEKKQGTVLEMIQAMRKMNTAIGQAILWDLTTGQMIRKFEGHNGRVRAVAISPDGRRLATAYDDNTLMLWDAASGQSLLTLTLKGRGSLLTFEGFTSVQFSPDGRQLLSGSRGEIVLWDAANGKELHSIRPGLTNQMIGVAFAPEGPLAITFGATISIVPGASTVRICIRNVASQKEVYSSICQEKLSLPAFALSPDGRYMATGSPTYNTAMVWDGGTGQRGLLGGNAIPGYHLGMYAEMILPGSAGALKGHSSSVNCLAFSPNGRQALTGSYDTTAILWDTETGRQIHKLQGHRGPSESLRKVVPFGLSVWLRYLASGGNLEDTAGSLRLEDMTRLGDSQPGYIKCVAFSADGRYVITGGSDEEAIVWKCATGQKVRELVMPRKEASGSSNDPPSPRHVDKVALSHDGKLALTGASDPRIVILWDLATGGRLQTLEENLNDLYALTFSADGQPLALARLKGDSVGYRISLTNVSTGQVARSSPRIASQHYVHNGQALLSSDQQRLAIAGGRGTIVVFDLLLGVELRRIEGHDADINSMAFSADRQRLLTGSDDGTCRLWDIATGQELARITTLRDQGDWLMMTPEGLFDGSAGGREKVMFRVGSSLNVVPVDRFFQDFYYPGLLAAIWRGERPLPRVQMGESLPPKVAIVAPDKGGVVEANRATVEVEVVDQGGGVRGPWLVQNGARVLASEKTEQKDKMVRRTFDVPLVQGENKLEFHAASADGSWESEPAVMTLRCERPLPKPELYLVSVGINRYAEESMNLGFAAGDAQAMAGLFQQRGPSLYSAVHATTLLDDQATTSAILESLRQLAEKARPQDTVAVFLSGHGAVAGQQYYFLPHEFHRQADALEEDVRMQGLSAGKLQEALVAIPALKRLVVFDTGQSGGKMGFARTARDPFAFRGAIERLSRASGAFMIASAAISDEAQEVADLKHGILTYALLAGLHAAEGGPLEKQWIQPTGKDRVADVLDWFGFASAYVPQLTKRYFGRQQELQHSSLGTSFPILPMLASGTPSPLASTAASLPASESKTSAVKGTGVAKLHVVAVGINQYREEAMNLKYAREDAKSMVELFRRRGQRQYREVSVAEVLDAQATKEGILNSLEKVARQAKAEDTLVVFLSGHGKMVGQRYYLIPHDFHRRENTIEEDIQWQGVPADVLADAVSKAPARKRILIFDTCASGGALGIGRQGQEPFAFRGAIEKLGERQGVFTIAASAAGQEAQEIPEIGHGVLTYALLAGLRAVPLGGPLEGLSVQPNGPDGVVDVLEWFSFASGHVPRLTKRYLHQMQEVQTGAQGTSFPLLSAWEQ